MGYRRNRWSIRSSYWNYEHISERAQLSEDFGGIDLEIGRIFLTLPNRELSNIFHRYGKKYGSSAEKYARKTYDSWRSGAVKMSGQTAARLLELVPPVLPADTRFELVKKLRAHYQEELTLFVRSTPGSWRQDLVEPLRKLMESSKVELPEQVLAKATWLANGDASAAQQLLAASEQQEAALRLAYIEEEMKRIEILLEDVDASRRVSHTLRLPQGSITLHIDLPARNWLQKIKDWMR